VPPGTEFWLGLLSRDEVQPDGSTVGTVELYAFKRTLLPDGQAATRVCRITRFRPSYYGFGDLSSRPSWSNGGDRFISFLAYDVVGGTYYIFRAPVTGAQLDAAIAAGVNLDLTPDDPSLERVVAIPGGFQGYRHTWSPNDTLVAYSRSAVSGANADQVHVKDLTTGQTTQVFQGDHTYDRVRTLSWSPDGGRIAISWSQMIYTVAPNGLGLFGVFPAGPG
jgi:Tol biopolymer transport system component